MSNSAQDKGRFIVEVRRDATARTAESGAATRPHPGPGHSRDDPAAGRAEAPSTMSCRGRGTLTVRRSDNPFFQTTTGDIGQDFTKEVEYAAPTVERAPPRRTLVDNYDFGFLYEKMSDDIGAGQHHAPSNLSRAMGAQDTPAQLTRLQKYVAASPQGSRSDQAALCAGSASGVACATLHAMGHSLHHLALALHRIAHLRPVRVCEPGRRRRHRRPADDLHAKLCHLA